MSTRKPAREPSVLGAISAGGTLGVANVAVAAVAAVGVIGVAAVAGGVLGVGALTAVVVKARKKSRKDKTVAGSANKAAKAGKTTKSGNAAKSGKSPKASKSPKGGGGSGKGLLSRGASKPGKGSRKGSSSLGGAKSGKGKNGKGGLLGGGLGKSAKGAVKGSKRSGVGSGMGFSKGSSKRSGKGSGNGLGLGGGRKGALTKAGRAAGAAGGLGAKSAKKALGAGKIGVGKAKKIGRSAAHKASVHPWAKFWRDKKNNHDLKKASMPKPRKKITAKKSDVKAVRPKGMANISRPSDKQRVVKGVNAVAHKVSGLPSPFRGATDALRSDVGSWKCGEGRDVLAMMEGFEELFKELSSSIMRARGSLGQRFPLDAASAGFLDGLAKGANTYAAYVEQGRLAYIGVNKPAIDYMNGATNQFDQSRNLI